MYTNIKNRYLASAFCHLIFSRNINLFWAFFLPRIWPRTRPWTESVCSSGYPQQCISLLHSTYFFCTWPLALLTRRIPHYFSFFFERVVRVVAIYGSSTFFASFHVHSSDTRLLRFRRWNLRLKMEIPYSTWFSCTYIDIFLLQVYWSDNFFLATNSSF